VEYLEEMSPLPDESYAQFASRVREKIEKRLAEKNAESKR